jgi:hypothetical protein
MQKTYEVKAELQGSIYSAKVRVRLELVDIDTKEFDFNEDEVKILSIERNGLKSSPNRENKEAIYDALREIVKEDENLFYEME